MARLAPLAVLVAAFFTACGTAAPPGPAAPSGGVRGEAPEMKDIAESYVKLVLAVGRHDADYVDSYYGPPDWKAEAERAGRPLAEIQVEAEGLLARLACASGDRR